MSTQKGSKKRRNQVVALNQDNQVLGFLFWRRAKSLVAIGRAELLSFTATTAGKLIYRVIRFVKLVRQFYGKKVGFSLKHVLVRDRRVCQYCGELATTVDHVIPKSRGGANSWENTVAACVACNGRKGNRTPREAGMFLKRQPFAPTINEFLHAQIACSGLDRFLAELFAAMTRPTPAC